MEAGLSVKMEDAFHFMNKTILGDISLIMFLERILIFLGAIGMMMTMGWHDTQRMMINPAKKYGYGDFPGRE